MTKQYKCPQCKEKCTIPRLDPRGLKHDKEPCPNCNGQGVVSPKNFAAWKAKND